MKVDPIKAQRPSNADLASGFNQLHTCLEDLKDKAATKEDLVPIRANVDLLTTAFGLHEGGKTTVATSTPLAAFWRTFGAVGASIASFFVIAKVAFIVWPFAAGLTKAIWHALETGKL